ncbi:unnamed protein product [Clonostachys rosea]|uniref:Uncharacterized protein n=1 Tax=Bionectria ochroleuca TaxID=29856 RepID=A0ABY6UV11_BIOOC|nr:unnamed protein product [Clonostachys rosea]
MTTTNSRLRSHSLGENGKNGPPQPARFYFEAPQRAASSRTKRSTVPRRTSTPAGLNHHALGKDVDQDLESAFRDIAREQVDRESLRELAQFLRNTGPPAAPNTPLVEDCFGRNGPGENRRWSIRSLRAGNRGSKMQQRPVSLNLGDSATRRTTAAGHSYFAISVPAPPAAPSVSNRRASLQSRLSAIQKSHLVSRLSAIDTESLAPRSSYDLHSPKSHTSSNTQKFLDRNTTKAGDVAAVVSRHPSQQDPNSFRLSIKVTTADRGVKSFMRLVDEWLEIQHGEDVSPNNKSASVNGSNHQAEDSGVVVLSALGPSSPPAPKIEVRPSPSPTEEREPPVELPTTPPIDAKKMSFPDATNIPHGGLQGTDASSATSPRSPESSKLSAFPNTQSSKMTSPKSPKPLKKPGNIMVKSMLEVPQGPNLFPESPGFPNMLAAMSFPSPPESIRSHSASNSISSTGPTTPPSLGPLSKHSPRSNLDQRLMQPERPPLRQSKSESATHPLYMSTHHGTLPPHLSRGRSFVDEPSFHSAHVSGNMSVPKRTSSKKDRRSSQESVDLTESDPHRQSTVSTVDSSLPSAIMSDNHRHSIGSVTSVTSGVTERTEVTEKIGRGSNRDSIESFSETRLPFRSQRSSMTGSLRSFSSAGTSATATSLAERRMARRNKVREKLQRDLEATKPNLQVPHDSMADIVDSPVLGWFPHHAPTRKGQQVPSPLAQQSSNSTEVANGNASGHKLRRSSIQNIVQLIPETVQEANSPKTPPPAWTFTSIMVETTEPDFDNELEPVPEDAPAPPSALSMTPIMVVASIESRSPTSSLRPLSLLSAGSSPPTLPPRSNLRPEKPNNIRQRPLPVRISKNPLDLTVNTKISSSKRNSISNISTIFTSPPPSDSQPSPRNSAPSLGAEESAESSTRTSSTTSQDKETQWLTAHQKQTAHDWRLAALKERMRRELDIEDDAEDDAHSEWEKRRIRDRHTSKTLKVLNANARKHLNNRSSSNASDGDKTPTSEVSVDGETVISSHNSVEKQLLRAIVPLLESMDSTLKEMQRENVNRELSKKFMDSALDIAHPLVESTKREPTDV